MAFISGHGQTTLVHIPFGDSSPSPFRGIYKLVKKIRLFHMNFSNLEKFFYLKIFFVYMIRRRHLGGCRHTLCLQIA